MIFTFTFYYFWEREREKYWKTREEIRRSGKSFGENIATNPAISVRRGVGGGYSNVNGDQRGDTF